MSLGKILKTLMVGDADILESKNDLKNCIANYSRALSEIVGIPAILEVREIVKGTGSCLQHEFDRQ